MEIVVELVLIALPPFWMYLVVTGHVAVGPDQIGLVAADNNQLRAVVVEQESPAAFKNQLDRLAPVACRMP